MNKLAEIKEDYEFRKNYMKDYGIILNPLEKKIFEDLGYALSLLEEKDKALTFYANEESYFRAPQHQLTYIELDNGKKARKALNSSNNEGEIQRYDTRTDRRDKTDCRNQ